MIVVRHNFNSVATTGHAADTRSVESVLHDRHMLMLDLPALSVSRIHELVLLCVKVRYLALLHRNQHNLLLVPSDLNQAFEVILVVRFVHCI